ncbi:preprotein translocase subunit Sec61beta [Candidatus Woesearchaeota archaeon]|nr:preprotein translocase subunit Sec61beta [Candidatus Woesearchaeota archaeon]
MADKKVQMPTSTAGLTRYFEDYRSKLEFKPGTIIIFSVIVILITIILHIYGGSILGF